MSLFAPAGTLEKLTFGVISETETGGWIIDAEPFVMQRVREIFKRAQPIYQPPGKFTHCRVWMNSTPDNARDIVWLTDRYSFEIESRVWDRLKRYSERYDRSLISAVKGDSNTLFSLSDKAYPMAEPPRDHQAGFRNLYRDVCRTLLADDIGLGKTISAISTLCEPEARPALIVVPAPLPRQWANQIKRFLPDASVHIIKGRKTYELPQVDVVITAYSRLQSWFDILPNYGFQSVVFDEVQDFRHVETQKRGAARAVSVKAEFCLGLSATPIHNLGGEIWSVLDVIAPDSLGDQQSFRKEFCIGDKVKDPVSLHSYLKSRGLMLRRTKQDLGIETEPVTREVITLEGDLEELKAIENVAKALAISVLRNEIGKSDQSARDLDWKLRQATGVAKAKAVAELVKQLAADGEKVFLGGWHREVYDIWLKELKSLKPVMYTGTETPAQKLAAVQKFTKGDAQVFICSLRSGVGLDGLQHVCRQAVLGELDWSPQVMDQFIGRLDREGQTKPVFAYFPVIEDGSDPFIVSLLAGKQEQSDGVVDGKLGRVEVLEASGPRSERIVEMAQAYLASIGEALPTAEPETGLHAEVREALKRLVLPTTSEAEMQRAIYEALPGLLPGAEVEREVRVGERSRLDFLVSREDERIAIECKIDQAGRGAVYGQVRRYAREAEITGLIVCAPWGGVRSFVVEGVPVSIVDWAKTKLKGGRHA